MMLEDSPSLEEYSDGIPPAQPEPPNYRRLARLVLLALSLAVLVMSWSLFQRTGIPAQMTGRGEISGVVLGDHGKPLRAEIFVLGTGLQGIANSEGRFVLKGVPAGKQSLAILHQDSGLEYPAVVRAGQTTELGEIRLVTTAEPAR